MQPATAKALAARNGKPPDPGPVDLPSIEAAVRTILRAVGEDPEREGLRNTPARVARMYAEVFAGLRQDAASHTRVRFTEKYDEIVLVKEIPFYSICEHHLLPFVGQAHVAYLPAGKVIGISKLARIVDAFARRPQVQERLTTQVAELLESELKPQGVAVVIEAVHSCMTIRGVQKPGASVTTSAMLGAFRKNLATRSEVLNLIHGGRS